MLQFVLKLHSDYGLTTDFPLLEFTKTRSLSFSGDLSDLDDDSSDGSAKLR